VDPYRKSFSTSRLTWIPAWCGHLVYLLRWKVFPVAAFLGMVTGITLAFSGCPDGALQIQAQTANAVAHAANAVMPVLVAQYRQDGLEAIQAVKEAGGTADDARAAIAAVKTKWEPVLRAWESLRVAQDTWATVLEAGGDTAAALAGLHVAYCGLQKVWPEDIPVVPLALVRCEP